MKRNQIVRRLAVFAAMAILLVLAGQPGAAQTAEPKPGDAPKDPALLSATAVVPNPPVAEQHQEPHPPLTVNAERRKQIADESALLLKMATELKAEVDKTNKDMLSLPVIRKADEIEKLAHTVREKMKQTPGAH